MKTIYFGILAGAVLGLGVVACGGGSTPQTVPIVTQGQYTQIELLARPAVKEVFEKFVDHQTTNAAEPYNDPTLQTQIKGLEDALRPPKSGADYGAALQSILYPNEYTIDLTQTTAAYLGVETGGATGGKFGGRAINDDVVDISLGALFGNTLSTLGVQPDDGQENNCISKQNITQAASQKQIAAFPYLPVPH